MELNDTRNRGRSVSRDYKTYQFYEKENKPNSMKCGFKTNKIVTAVKETDHTASTSEAKIIHKKLASNSLKFQTSKKPDKPKRFINRCRRCGKFSSGEYCETHMRLAAKKDTNNNGTRVDAGPSHTMPSMPSKKPTYNE